MLHMLSSFDAPGMSRKTAVMCNRLLRLSKHSRRQAVSERIHWASRTYQPESCHVRCRTEISACSAKPFTPVPRRSVALEAQLSDSPNMAPSVGFIGMGIMGEPMARNLLKSEKFSSVTVWNRTSSKVSSQNLTLSENPARLTRELQ
jgi:hypothetical protein